jgi:hypothetical protein
MDGNKLMDTTMTDEKCIEHGMMIEAQGDKISALEHTVYGNGKIGLKEEVTVLRTKMNVITMLCAAILSGVVAVLVKLITM